MDERIRNWRRWADSENDGRDDEADAAFHALFRAVPVRQPGPAFSDLVARTTARAAARQARLARGAVIAGAAAGLALTLALARETPRLLGASLDLIIRAVVSTTLALGRGVDAWTLLGQIARAVGGAVVTPQGTYALSGLGLIAIVALYALHRMLEMEERSSL